MEGVAYLLIVDVPVDILAANKLEMPVDKNLVIVEIYPLMKPTGWDFIVKKIWKILFVKYGV